MTIDSKKQALDKIHQAIKLSEKQQRQKAYIIFQDCLQTMPDELEVNVGFGSLCLSLGESGHAIKAFSKAVQSNPDNPVYLGFLGRAYLINGQLKEADAQLRKALDMSPPTWELLADLGATSNLLGNDTDALKYYTKSHNLKPGNPIVLSNLAISLLKTKQHGKALKYAEKAIKLDPTSYMAYSTIGSVLTDMGRLSETVEYLEKGIKLNKYYPQLYYDLSRAKKFTHQDKPLISRIEKILEGSMSANDRSYFCFALAKMYDDCKEWDQSFAYTKQANLLAKPINKGVILDYRNQFKSVKRVFSKNLFDELKPAGNQTKKPVFIIGMPRSGTTLVEQIIARHPEVATAGELLEINKLANSISSPSNPKQYQQDWDKFLNPESIREIGEKYLNKLRLNREEALRVTDKMPENYFHLGLITLLFPNASIIHVIRNPLDTCFSCYFQFFGASALSWSFKPDAIARRYKDYRKTIEFWKSILPTSKILDVQYEQLIDDPESISRKMLEHCKLDWDPACLNVYESDNVVATASAWQVRQPIYKTSIKRWRRYGPQISELAIGIAEYLDEDDRQYLVKLGIKLKSKHWWNFFGIN